MMGNKFILGDCMDKKNGLPSYPDNYFGLAIIDPPYGIQDDGRKHQGRVFRKDGTAIKKRDKRNGAVVKVKPQKYKLTSRYDNEQPNQEYFDELFRVSKYQIIWGCNYLQFDQKAQSSGRIFWDKVNGDCDQSDFEVAWTNLFSSVRRVRYMWNGLLQGRSLREGHISQGNRALCEKRVHPNHKPTKLYSWVLKLEGIQKDWILLDTHVGGASSLLTFERFDMNYVGYEIDPDYYAAAKRRMSAGIQKDLFSKIK